MENEYKNKDKNPPYTGIPNEIFNKIITTRLTARELKVIYLIIRFTYGCHKEKVFLLQKDFLAAGLIETKIKKIINGLITKKILLQNNKNYSINTDVENWAEKQSGSMELLTNLVGRTLSKRKVKTYQNGKLCLAGKESYGGENANQVGQNIRTERNYKENIKKYINRSFRKNEGFEAFGEIAKKRYKPLK